MYQNRKTKSQKQNNNPYQFKLLIEVLIITCFSGIYYNFNLPVGIYDQIKTHFKSDLQEFEHDFNYFYGSVSWINILLPMIIGIFIDYFRNVYVLTFLVFCNFIGTCIISLGAEAKNFHYMVFGRFVTGIAIGSILPLTCKLMTSMFKRKRLSFIISLNLGIACLFDGISVIISPLIADSKSLQFAFQCGITAALVSIVSCVLIYFLDGKQNKNRLIQIEQKNVQYFSFEFWMISFLLFLNFTSFSGSQSNFIPIQQDIMISQTGRKINESDQSIIFHHMVIWFLLPVLILPTCGFFIDKSKYKYEIILSSTLVMGMCQFLSYSMNSILYSLLMPTSFYLFFCCIWTSIPFILDYSILGLGYGNLMAVKFSALAFSTFYIGRINNQVQGSIYISCLQSFGSLNFVGVIVAGILWSRMKEDNNLKLNKNNNQIDADEIF